MTSAIGPTACRARRRAALRSSLPALALAAALLLAGCGYAMSGEWTDDPANWGRAFGTTKPDEVVVRHSEYWRSPHWTLEYEYFFEIEPNAGLAKQAFGGNDLVRVEGEDAARVRDDAFRERPPWFAPRPVDRYEVWILRDQPDSRFRLLIDRETGTWFMADYQV